METNRTSEPLTLAAILGHEAEPDARELALPVTVARATEYGTQVDEVGAILRRPALAAIIARACAEQAAQGGRACARLTAAHTDAIALVYGAAVRRLADACVIGAAKIGATLASGGDSAGDLRASVSALLPVLGIERAESVSAALAEALAVTGDRAMPEITRASIVGHALAQGVEASAAGMLAVDLGATAAASLAVSAAVETIRASGPQAMRAAVDVLSDYLAREEGNQ